MKSFFLGVVTGVVLTISALFVISLVYQSSTEVDEQIQYLEPPVIYEHKTETSFQVFQVIGNTALAKEASDKIDHDVLYLGNVVLLLGENFYSDQVVIVKNPKRVGTYNYTTNSGLPKTVPVIDGEMN